MRTCFTTLLFLLYANSLADDQTFTISGKILLTHSKPVYILLVDEQTSQEASTGISSRIIRPDSAAAANGNVTYKFENIKAGVYGIRCFQDMNGNQKLDMGMFGPKEPWGLSWNGAKTFGRPSFKDYSFTLAGDTSGLNIELSK